VQHPNWTKTGWFGTTVRTPKDWNLGAISGEEFEGYIRVDSPDGAAVEIRWRTQKGAVDLESVLDQYFKKLSKSSKKSPYPLETNRKPKALQGIRPAGRKPLTFSWKGDRRALGAVWACPTCDRVVIAQVVWPLEGKDVPAAEILDSIEDHPVDGKNTWALYDLEVKIPKEYKIQRQKLMSGYIKLDFTYKASSLIVERWGPADVILKDATLSEWIQQKNATSLKQYRFEETEQTFHGHSGAQFRGTLKGIRRRLKAFWMGIFKQRPPQELVLSAWHCPEANRIFIISGMAPIDDPIVGEVVDSLICH
jgi:hypothetical protein